MPLSKNKFRVNEGSFIVITEIALLIAFYLPKSNHKLYLSSLSFYVCVLYIPISFLHLLVFFSSGLESGVASYWDKACICLQSQM